MVYKPQRDYLNIEDHRGYAQDRTFYKPVHPGRTGLRVGRQLQKGDPYVALTANTPEKLLEVVREFFETGRIHKKQRAVWWQFMRPSLQGIVPQLRRAWKGGGALLYAGYMYFLLLVLAPMVWTAVVAAPGFEKAYRAMRYFAGLFFRLGRIPITIQGAAHLDPSAHCIVVSNHCSFADGPILAAALPIHTSYVAKAELSRNVFSRLFFTRLRTAFVERFDSHKGTTDARKVIRSAQCGRSYIFFPEGTFYHMPGLQPFRMGAFLTAARAGVPVVPVAIRGSRSLLRGDTWFPRRKAVSVRVCSPISPKGNDWEAAVQLRDAARDEILKYCGEPDMDR
jgi:1-acyl-sn-glycerol-3-phosphate acyltransferase